MSAFPDFAMPTMQAPDARSPLEHSLAKLNQAWQNYMDTLDAKKRHEVAITELARAQIDFEDQMTSFRKSYGIEVSKAMGDLRRTAGPDEPFQEQLIEHCDPDVPVSRPTKHWRDPEHGPNNPHPKPFSDVATRGLK